VDEPSPWSTVVLVLPSSSLVVVVVLPSAVFVSHVFLPFALVLQVGPDTIAAVVVVVDEVVQTPDPDSTLQ
jgi:hypothetical protein